MKTCLKSSLKHLLIYTAATLLLFTSTTYTSEADILVDENTYFYVGNVQYNFSDEMIFNWIDQWDEYIVFNTSTFFITSANPLNITLEFLNDSVIDVAQGDLLIKLDSNTTGGAVQFEIDGFLPLHDYTVKRNGDVIASVSANETGFIAFSNNIWDTNKSIEIYRSIDTTPALFDIRDIRVSDSVITKLKIYVTVENVGDEIADITMSWTLDKKDNYRNLDKGSDTFAVPGHHTTTYFIQPETQYIGEVIITFSGYGASASKTFFTADDVYEFQESDILWSTWTGYPRYRVAINDLNSNTRVKAPSYYNVGFIFKKDKPIKNLKIFGYKQDKYHVLKLEYDYGGVYEIESELETYTHIVGIPNPGWFDSKFWLELLH